MVLLSQTVTRPIIPVKMMKPNLKREPDEQG